MHSIQLLPGFPLVGLLFVLAVTSTQAQQAPGVQGCVGATCGGPLVVPGVQGCVGSGCKEAEKDDANKEKKPQKEQKNKCDDLRAKLRDINKQLASLQRERQEALKQSQDSIQSLHDRLAGADTRIATIEATIQPVLDKIDEIEKQIDALEEQITDTADSSDENPIGPGGLLIANKVKILGLQNEIRSLNEQISGDQAELSGLDKQKTRLTNELATAQTQYQTLSDSFADRDAKLRNKKAALEKQLKACKSKTTTGDSGHGNPPERAVVRLGCQAAAIGCATTHRLPKKPRKVLLTSLSPNEGAAWHPQAREGG